MIDFDYQIRKSIRRKTISITVYADNRVLVAVPSRMSRKSVLQFIEAKSDWVRKTITRNLEKAKTRTSLRFVHGEKLPYLGSQYTLHIEEGYPEGVFSRDGELRVRLNGFGALNSRSEQIRDKLFQWYIEQAEREIEERTRLYGTRIGVMPKSVTIKRMRCRWGSCSVKGSINLAWNIIMAPEDVLDYLIVHELCHLVHHNHSAQYWSLVAAVLPDYHKSRKWLRENGDYLTF